MTPLTASELAKARHVFERAMKAEHPTFQVGLWASIFGMDLLQMAEAHLKRKRRLLSTEKQASLSQHRLMEVVAYDPDTGIFRWKLSLTNRVGAVAGSRTKSGYTEIRIDRKRYYAHRLAWFYAHGEWPTDGIDHIDGNRANNKLSNLRVANQSENCANSRQLTNNTSGYRGIYLCTYTRRWRARLTVRHKTIDLGRFDTREEAYQAYRRAAEEHHGEFAAHNSVNRGNPYTYALSASLIQSGDMRQLQAIAEEDDGA